MVQKITLKKLLERWNIDSFELHQILLKAGIPIHHRPNKPRVTSLGRGRTGSNSLEQIFKECDDRNLNVLENYYVNKSDVETFEDKNPEINSSFSDKDARKLGQLKREKSNWDSSLKAAIKIGLYCSELDHKLTRDMLIDKLCEESFDLPDTTIDRIWKAIPEKYKQGEGRPSKN